MSHEHRRRQHSSSENAAANGRFVEHWFARQQNMDAFLAKARAAGLTDAQIEHIFRKVWRDSNPDSKIETWQVQFGEADWKTLVEWNFDLLNAMLNERLSPASCNESEQTQ